jgi:hypothetical protein
MDLPPKMDERFDPFRDWRQRHSRIPSTRSRQNADTILCQIEKMMLNAGTTHRS